MNGEQNMLIAGDAKEMFAMKKLFSLLICLALLILLALPALATDSTWLMLADMSGSQDALLVGKVIEDSDYYILFDVVRTVNGKPAKSPFQLNKAEPSAPIYATGDGILASVQYFRPFTRDIGTYGYGGSYMVELKQDKKIKMDIEEYDVAVIEWYVNTGEFGRYGSYNDNFYRRKKDGSEGQLLFDGKQWHVDSLNRKFKAPQVRWEPLRPVLIGIHNMLTVGQVLLLRGCVLAVGFIGCMIGFLLGRRH